MSSTYDTINWAKLGKTLFTGKDYNKYYIKELGTNSRLGTGGEEGTVTSTHGTPTNLFIEGNTQWILEGVVAHTHLENGEEVILHIEFPFPIEITKYDILPYLPWQGMEGIIDWKFEGSHDNISWNTLDTQIDQGVGVWGSTYDGALPAKSYIFINTTSYKYYRFYITKVLYVGGANSSAGILEINLYSHLQNNLYVSAVDINDAGDILAIAYVDDSSSKQTSFVKIYHLDENSNWEELGHDISGDTDSNFGSNIKLDPTYAKIYIGCGSYTNNDISNCGQVFEYEYSNRSNIVGGGGLTADPTVGSEEGVIVTPSPSASPATNFFDNNSNNYVVYNHNPTNGTNTGFETFPFRITYKFSTDPVLIDCYKIVNRYNQQKGPTDWSFQASHDGVNWITFDNVSNHGVWTTRLITQHDQSDFINLDYYGYTKSIQNNTKFLYYSFLINNTSGGGGAHYIGELILGKTVFNPSGIWINTNIITSGNEIIDGGFGNTGIDINSAGNKIIIAQSHLSIDIPGEIFIYDYNYLNKTWDLSFNVISGDTNERIGDTLIMSDDGNTILSAGLGSGSNKIKIFDISNGIYTLTYQITGFTNSNVGKENSAALSGDGKTFAYAGPTYNNNMGYAEVYIKNGSNWEKKGNRIEGKPDRDNKGPSLGLNGIKLNYDGTKLILSKSNYNRIGKIDIYTYTPGINKWFVNSTIYTSNKEWFPMVNGGGYGKFGYKICSNSDATIIGACADGINGDLSNNINFNQHNELYGIFETFAEVDIPFSVIPHSINNKMNNLTYNIGANSNHSSSLSNYALLNEDINVEGGITRYGMGGDKTTNDTYIGFITNNPYTLNSIDAGFKISIEENTSTSEFIIASNYTKDTTYYNPGRSYFKPRSDLLDSYDILLHFTSIYPSTGINYILEAGAGGRNGTGGDQGQATASIYGWEATKAFNNNSTQNNFWDSYGENPSWLKFTLPVNEEKTISMYRIWPNRDNGSNSSKGIPKSWTFEGSNDDISWNTLDTQTDVTGWVGTDDNSVPNLTEYLEFSFVNNTSYRYYRLHVTDSQKSWNPGHIEYSNADDIETQIVQLALYSIEKNFNIKINTSTSSSITGPSNEIINPKTLQITKTTVERELKLSYYNENNEYKENFIYYDDTNIPDDEYNPVTTGTVKYIKLLMKDGNNINIDRGYMLQSLTGQNSNYNIGVGTNDSNKYIISRFLLHANNRNVTLPNNITYNTNGMAASEEAIINDNAQGTNLSGNNDSNSNWENVLIHGENKFIGGGVGTHEHWTLIELNTPISLDSINAIFIEPGNGLGHSNGQPGSNPSIYGGLDPDMNYIRGLQVQLLDENEDILNSVTIPKTYRLDAYSEIDQRSIVIEYTKNYSSKIGNGLDNTVKQDPFIIDPYTTIKKNADDPKYFIFASTGDPGNNTNTKMNITELPGIVKPEITQINSSFTCDPITGLSSMHLQQNQHDHYYMINNIQAIQIRDNNIVINIPPVLINNSTEERIILESTSEIGLTQASPLYLKPAFYTIYFNQTAYSDEFNNHSSDISFTFLIEYVNPVFNDELPTISIENMIHTIDISSILTFIPFDINDLTIEITNITQGINTSGNAKIYKNLYCEAGRGSRNGLDYGDNGIATASSVFDANRTADHAFDGQAANSNNYYWMASTDTTSPDINNQWLKFEFYYPKIITFYRIWPVNPTDDIYANPSEWTFEGSYDDISWDTLDTITGLTSNDWGDEIPNNDDLLNDTKARDFPISNINPYKYYRLNITSTSRGDGTGSRIMELALFSSKLINDIQYIDNGKIIIDLRDLKMEAGPDEFIPINPDWQDQDIDTTSYRSIDGESEYNVSVTSKQGTNNGIAWLFQRGLNSGNYNWISNTTDNNNIVTITIEFNEPKKIIHYKMWPIVDGYNLTPNTWNLLASNDENSWTILDEKINITEWHNTNVYSYVNNTDMNEYDIINNTSYKYYKFDISLSNHTSAQGIGQRSLGVLALYSKKSTNFLSDYSYQSTPNINTALNFNIKFNTFSHNIVKTLTIENLYNKPRIIEPTDLTINKMNGDSLNYTINNIDTNFNDLSYNIVISESYKGIIETSLSQVNTSYNELEGSAVTSSSVFWSSVINVGRNGGPSSGHVTLIDPEEFIPTLGINNTLNDQNDAWISDIDMMGLRYIIKAGPHSLNGRGGNQGILTASTDISHVYSIMNDDRRYYVYNGNKPPPSHPNFDPAEWYAESPYGAWWTGDVDDWIKYKFPEPQLISMYRLWCTKDDIYRVARSWTIEGSHDDITWYIIDVAQNITHVSSVGLSRQWNATAGRHAFTSNPSYFLQREITNDISYSYYRLTINERPNPQHNQLAEDMARISAWALHTPDTSYLNKPEWLQFSFPVNNEQAITKYTIWPAIRSYNSLTSLDPKSWTFEGSMDNISWDVLDTQTNITDWELTNSNSFTNNTEMKIFTFVNTVKYRRYRIYITETNGNINAYKSIGLIKLEGTDEDNSILTFNFTSNSTNRNYNDITINVADTNKNVTSSLTSTVFINHPYTNIDNSNNSTTMVYDLDLYSMATKP